MLLLSYIRSSPSLRWHKHTKSSFNATDPQCARLAGLVYASAIFNMSASRLNTPPAYKVSGLVDGVYPEGPSQNASLTVVVSSPVTNAVGYRNTTSTVNGSTLTNI